MKGTRGEGMFMYGDGPSPDREYFWAMYVPASLKRLKTAYSLTAIACIVLAIFVLIFIAKMLSTPLKDVIAAIGAFITGLLSLVSAALGYVLTRMKEVEMAGMQRMRELEIMELQKNAEMAAAYRATKQKNYERIIETLAPHVRKHEQASDNFSTAYLHTWVIGSTEVLTAMQKFLDTPSSLTLDEVLMAMRQDLAVGTEGVETNEIQAVHTRIDGNQKLVITPPSRVMEFVSPQKVFSKEENGWWSTRALTRQPLSLLFCRIPAQQDGYTRRALFSASRGCGRADTAGLVVWRSFPPGRARRPAGIPIRRRRRCQRQISWLGCRRSCRAAGPSSPSAPVHERPSWFERRRRSRGGRRDRDAPDAGGLRAERFPGWSFWP